MDEEGRVKDEQEEKKILYLEKKKNFCDTITTSKIYYVFLGGIRGNGHYRENR